MDFTVPRTYYTEWWNINTHRCNHINRPPVNQEMYGYGRSFVGDWARTGAVSISHVSDKFQIESQMSTKLVGKLQYFHNPVPLLPTHYSYSLSGTNKSSFNYDQQLEGEERGKNKKLVDSSTVRDYGYEQLLNDYILGEQACAAFLCGKLQGLLRANISKFMQINHDINGRNDDVIVADAKYNSISHNFIEQLFDMSEKGLNDCDSVDSQNKLIKRIQKLIVSGTKSTDSFPGSLLSSLNPNSTSGTAIVRNNQPSTKRRRLTTKPSKATKATAVEIGEGVDISASGKSEQLLPCTIGRLLYPAHSSLSSSISSSSTTLCGSDNLTLESDYSRLLASFDPLVIRLASRIVNPNYLGNGLLCNVRAHNYQSSTNHSDILLWHSLQTNSFCIGKTSNLLKTNIHESNRFSIIPIPLTKLSSRSFCELDASFSESSEKIDIVGRLLPTPGSKTNVVHMQIKINEPNMSNSCIENVSLIRMSSSNYVTSICMSRWIPGEWCMVGNYLDGKRDRRASIRLYNSEDTRLPMWSGHVNLGNYMENITKENSLCLESIASSSYKQDPVQSDIESYCTCTSRKHLLHQHYPNYHWLRVGFGSYPGELCLTTTRRILIFDTRTAPSCAYQLFNTSERSSLLNSNDHITYSPPKWIGDVYVLTGGYYSMVLLDKRMPNRTVLHWSHNLTKPLAYLTWTEIDKHYRSTHDIPQFLISMTSQYPADMSTFGLNFNSFSGPQYIGPCLSGTPLTSLVSSFRSNDLFQFYNQNSLLKRRLQSSICGITTHYSPDDTKKQFHTLLLTPYGDLFDYCAYLTSDGINTNDYDIVESYQVKSQTIITNWLSELSCEPENKQHVKNSEENAKLYKQSELKNHTGTLNLNNIVSERRQSVTNKLNNESIVEESTTDSNTNNDDYFTLKRRLNTSESFNNSSMEYSKWLLSDLKSIWDYDQGDKLKYEDQNALGFTSMFFDSLTENRMQEEMIHQKLITNNDLNELLDQRLIKFKKLYIANAFTKSVGDCNERWPCMLTPVLPEECVTSLFESEYYTAEEL